MEIYEIEINLLHYMWIIYSVIVTVIGFNLLCNESKSPLLLTRLFKFGKMGKHLMNKKSFARYLEVPKRWFGHFYIFASIYFFLIMLEVWRRYFIGTKTQIVTDYLNFFTTTKRNGSVTPESVIVLSFLLVLQACRRAFECFFVSVYSDAKMSIFHYIVGITFYMAIGQSLLCEAPGFEADVHNNIHVKFSNDWLTWKHLSGIIIFLLAFIMQYQAHVALANLRKDSDGKQVVTLKHVMPTGGWFEFVSCPHFFAEIVLYFSANIIFDFQNKTWWLACLWTASNQIVIGLLSHQWYLKTFKNYPKSRKAVIPWLL